MPPPARECRYQPGPHSGMLSAAQPQQQHAGGLEEMMQDGGDEDDEQAPAGSYPDAAAVIATLRACGRQVSGTLQDVAGLE